MSSRNQSRDGNGAVTPEKPLHDCRGSDWKPYRIKSENAQGANEAVLQTQTCRPPFPMCNGLVLALGLNSLQRKKQQEEETDFDSKPPEN